MSVGLPVYTRDLLGMDGWGRATRRWEREGLVEKLWASDPSVWGNAAPSGGRVAGMAGPSRDDGRAAWGR